MAYPSRFDNNITRQEKSYSKWSNIGNQSHDKTNNDENVFQETSSNKVDDTKNLSEGEKKTISPDSEMKTQVSKVISESKDLITALEAVGAMYGIPSENIMVDNSLRSIKVMNDIIVAPNTKNVTENTKAIVCSIGSVLDYISQRVDDKLNNYQQDNIVQAKQASVCRQANPSKGKVLNRYVDDNGDEIIVYDTGLVDMANTKEANRKVDELRQDMKIPMYNPDTMKRPTYFSDEDDITKDIDMNATSGPDIEPFETNDIGSEIQESHIHLDMISKFNNTRHLGCDMLRSQGFDYVQPIGIVQEADSKKSKDISITDIQHMKFDNTNIIKAIEYMNKARSEQVSTVRGGFTVKELINNKNWQKAIDCLNKQFNIRINLRFCNTTDGNDSSLYTSIWNDIKNNLTISKSKGFQMNGLPIDIFCIDKSIDEESPKNDQSMFGQFVISGLLHEIFHNVISVIRQKNGEFNATMSTALMVASSTDSSKERRIILSKYVDSLNEFSGKKLNIITRRKLVKELLMISAVQYDETMMKELKKKIDDNDGDDLDEKEIDQLISRYEEIIQKYEKRKKRLKSPVFKLSNIFGLVIGLLLSLTIIFAPLGIFIALNSLTNLSIDDKDFENMKSEKNMEEYYCDLFAGMYKLPLAFLLGPPNNKTFTANSISIEKLNKLASLEKTLYEIMCSKYPTVEERTYAAVKIAKKLLEDSDDIEPSFKEYCEWIVNNHSNILNTDIEKDYNDNTFDPKAADDLDKHLQTLISDNNITLTESEIMKILNGDVVIGD